MRLLGQVWRFALVGVLNTAVYYALYRGFKLALPYLLAHVVAFVISVVVSFFLNCWFTYRVRPTWAKFLRFPLSTLFNFAVTTVGLYVLVTYAHLGRDVAPLAAAAIAIPVTFLVARRILVGPGVASAAALPPGELARR